MPWLTPGSIRRVSGWMLKRVSFFEIMNNITCDDEASARAACEWYVKAMHDANRVAELELENAMLREAMQEIARRHPGYGGTGDIARRALPNTPAHSPPPLDPRFARFGEAIWEYIIKRGGDFCRDEISEDILPLAEAAGLCCRVKYDPGAHGDMMDAEPGCEIWWWGNF